VKHPVPQAAVTSYQSQLNYRHQTSFPLLITSSLSGATFIFKILFYKLVDDCQGNYYTKTGPADYAKGL
jgi:hypothetical protein